MATFSRIHLSSSTGGQPITVAATATPGTNVHTTGVATTTFDEVYLWAHNSSDAAVKLTVEYGGTGDPQHHVEVTVQPESGLVMVLPGLSLSGDGVAGRSVKAFAGTANVITVVGHVNRIA